MKVLTTFSHFFLQSYRYQILDFSGVEVKTIMDINSEESKFCFRKYDNGEYSKEEIYITGIPTKHPNVLKAILIGKKFVTLFANNRIID